MKNVIFTYKYNFNKVIRIISESQMVFGNESGPNCIAASSNVPLIVSLYNSKTYKSSKTINKNVIFFKSNTSLTKIKKKIIFILNKNKK